jgi:hypothetical protein
LAISAVKVVCDTLLVDENGDGLRPGLFASLIVTVARLLVGGVLVFGSVVGACTETSAV